jgi:uncharacterized protein
MKDDECLPFSGIGVGVVNMRFDKGKGRTIGMVFGAAPRSIRALLADGLDSYRLVLAVLVLNVPLIALIILRDAGTRDLTWLTGLYLFTVALGYYGLPLLVVATLLFLLLMPVRRGAAIGSGVLVTLFVYYLLLDSYVYGIFKFHIDPFWMEFAVKDYGSLGVTRLTLLAALAMLPIVAAVELGIFALASRFAALKRFALAFPLFVVMAFGVSQVLHVVTYERNDQRITGLTPCLPIYVPATSHGEAVRYGDLLPLGEDDPPDGPEERGGASMRYPLHELRFDTLPGETPPSIVIVMLESWRRDAFDEMTTPNIFALGRESSVFLDHLSSGNQTTCGIFGLFYGLSPTYWTAVKANSAAIDNPVLIDVLKRRGYAFGIYAKSNFERHKLKDTIFNGIDVHETFSGRTIPDEDVDMTGQVIRFVKEQVRLGKPYLALAFYKSCHAPYECPREMRIFDDTRNVGMTLGGDTDPAPYFNDYRNAVHYVDMLAGEIFDTLRTLGVMEKTIVVVTTDHGESFNESRANYWGHGSNFTGAQIGVPLILHAPGRAPQRIERRTSHIDLPQTLLQDYFGCTSDPSDYSDGRNLFDSTQVPRPLVIGSYVFHAFVFGDDVYEILPSHTKKYKLDDIRREAAPPDADLLKTVIEGNKRFMNR